MFITSESPLVLAARALSRKGQPTSALLALDRALQLHLGHKLFTVLIIDAKQHVSRRIYSSAPDQYPCEGTKPFRPGSDFYRTVFLAGEPRICPDREACRQAFPDHALIESLGCESAVNVPIRWNGATMGSLNLLHKQGWYDATCLPLLAVYATLAIPILIQAKSEKPS